MAKREKSTFSPPALGGSSLLTVFAVLCLTVFALLSLSTVRADLRLAQHSRQAVQDYYAADARAQEILASIDSIPCTACRYCTDGCPMKINIPGIFGARNKQLIFEQVEQGEKDYVRVTQEGGKASDCIGCGQCEAACPQHINIIERLKQCSEVFDR